MMILSSRKGDRSGMDASVTRLVPTLHSRPERKQTDETTNTRSGLASLMNLNLKSIYGLTIVPKVLLVIGASITNYGRFQSVAHCSVACNPEKTRLVLQVFAEKITKGRVDHGK